MSIFWRAQKSQALYQCTKSCFCKRFVSVVLDTQRKKSEISKLRGLFFLIPST